MSTHCCTKLCNVDDRIHTLLVQYELSEYHTEDTEEEFKNELQKLINKWE